MQHIQDLILVPQSGFRLRPLAWNEQSQPVDHQGSPWLQLLRHTTKAPCLVIQTGKCQPLLAQDGVTPTETDTLLLQASLQSPLQKEILIVRAHLSNKHCHFGQKQEGLHQQSRAGVLVLKILHDFKVTKSQVVGEG